MYELLSSHDQIKCANIQKRNRRKSKFEIKNKSIYTKVPILYFAL